MNEAEIEQTAQLLVKLEPGFTPYPIFEQIARIVALPVVEVIPMRLNDQNEVEVLLIDRGPDDPLWPNLLHTPGTIVLATDINKGETSHWPAFHRIFHDELKDAEVGAPHYVGSIFHQSKRGAEQAQLYWVEISQEQIAGEFYPIAKLPEALINSQVEFISLAGEQFKAYHNV